MFNEEIAEEIIKMYGRESAILYCKMESFRYRKQALELEKSRVKGWPNEFKHEADWWENKFNELKLSK